MFFGVFHILEIAFDQYILCVLWKKQHMDGGEIW